MENDAYTQIIARLGVSFDPAISSMKAMADVTAQLDRQLRGLKLTVADLARTANVDLRTQVAQMAGGKVIYDQYGRALTVAGISTEQLAQKTKTATQAAKDHAKTVRDLQREYTVLGSQFERRASWFLAGSAFFGSLAAAGEAARTIAEVEMGVTQIARVMEDATFNFKEFRDELLKLGVEYAQPFETVQDIALRFAQAGYNAKDTLELTRTALLALSSAELDAKNATESMIGIMAQWQLTAKDLPLLLDRLNKTADDYTVTTQDLVDGLLRSSGAAKIMGLTLEQTIALLTVMREASGRTGREVGTALNSILSYIQRPKSIEVLSSLGIPVFADEARTQFRNVMDIFQDIAARWNTLSAEIQEGFLRSADDAGLFNEELATALGLQEQWNDLQQRDISQAAAGVYRRNYFIAMIERLSKAQDVLNNMMDAAGYSARETERTLQTLEAQYRQLKSAAEQLAVAIGDAGLLNELKGLVSGLRDAITWFNELDPTLRNLIINFIEVTAALKVLNAVLRMANGRGAAGLLSGWAVSATAATAATRTLTSAVTGLGTVLANAAKGVVGFFGGPLGFALAVGTTALITFANSAKDSEAALKKNAEEAMNTANEIARLRDRYLELSGQANLTAAQQEELRSVTDQLLKLVPSAVTGFDEMGNAITSVGIAADESAKKIARLKAENERFIRAQASIGQAVLPELRRQLSETKKNFEILSEAAKQGPEIARGALLQMGGGIAEQIKLHFADSVRIAEIAEERLTQMMEEIAEKEKKIAEYELAQKAAEGLAKAPEPVPARTTSPGYLGTPAGTREARADVDAIAEALRDLANAADLYSLAVQAQEASLASLDRRMSIVNAEYDYLNEKLKTGVFTADDYARMQVLVAQKISLLRQEQVRLAEANEQYQSVIDALRPVLDEAIRQYEYFQAVGDAEHMRQAQDAVSKLQQEIEQLNDSIAKNTAKVWENKGTIESLTNAVYRAYYQNLTSWMQHMENIGRLTVEQQLEILRGIDLQKLALQDRWRVEEDIYRRRRKALQDEMDAIREAYDERMRQIEKEIEAEEEATQRKIEEREKRIDAIEEETNAQIAALQALIDALDVEDEQSDREEAERQHNQKLADLQEQYQYHALRTGLEHEKAMAEIQRQIAEEEHNWELQKQEWARQDQRKAYQDQIEALREQAKARQDAIRQEIDDIRKASDQKKKELQNYYDEIQRLLNDKTLDMLASLSMTDEQWYQRGLEWMRQLAAGIRDGQTELPSGVKEFIGEAEEAGHQQPAPQIPAEPPTQPVAVFGPSEYIEKNDRAYAWARLIGQKLGLPVDWDEQRGLVTIGNKSFVPDFIENDKAYLWLRTVGTVLGYLVDYADGIVKFLPKAHIGAYVRGSGIAELLQGERVLSPRLTVSFDRLASVLANFPNIPDRIALAGRMLTANEMEKIAKGMTDRLIATLERRTGVQIDKLLNVENMSMEDGTDAEILSRELARMVNQISTAKG